VQSKKSDILKRLKKRKNFNQKLLKNLKAIQYQSIIKRKNLNLLLKMILQKIC
jgi:dephospho-CoA kinase